MQVEVIVLLDWKRSASWGNVKTTLGYQQDKNKINNEAEYYYPWYHKYGTRTTALKPHQSLLGLQVQSLMQAVKLDYKVGYTGYKTSSQECPVYHNDICGNYIGRATLYEKTKFKNYISYDMRFAYKQPIFNNQSLDII